MGEFETGKYGIRRHYTEAFAMRKDIYNNLIKLCNKPTLEEGAKAAYEVAACIKKANEDSVCLTIKNYRIKYGLSSFIFDDINKGFQLYEIQGPLGPGLNIQTKGIHAAFSAGTGVLVFIDLVAHLIIRIL